MGSNRWFGRRLSRVFHLNRSRIPCVRAMFEKMLLSMPPILSMGTHTCTLIQDLKTEKKIFTTVKTSLTSLKTPYPMRP